MVRRTCQGLCLLLASLWAGVATGAPALRVEPGPQVLEGEPVHLSVVDATAGAELTVTAERWVAAPSTQRPTHRLMRSEAVFVADPEGRVDLRTARPLRGSYTHADPRGLFWSMTPAADAGLVPPAPVDTTEVRFQLRAGELRHTASVRLMPSLPEVQVRRAQGLPGAVFAVLPGDRKRPAVILLGGSEGGSMITHDAAPFASHGFAVLALPVFSPPDRSGAREIPELPAAWADMPVETLDKARAWLASQPEVDATRIAVHGTSMGALLGLLGAVHLPWVAAVVANVPSDLVWDGWGPGIELGQRSTFSVAGRPLPFVPLVGFEEEMQGHERKQPVILRRTFERGIAARPDLVAKARVEVERIRVPVMVIGAYDDQMWPSGQMAQNIVERRAQAGLTTRALLYRDAGHLLYDKGYAPTTGYNAGLRKSGGTARSNAQAQAEVWPETIRFLKRALGVPAD